MPLKIEHDGKEIEVYTREELDAEVKGLKITNENLKSEKQEALDKVREAKEAAREAEEAKAKAEGDKETLQRIADERAAEKDKRINDLINSTKKEKINNAVNDIITQLGAGGEKNEDLRDLIRARFEFDYDIDESLVKVSGEGVSTVEDLKRTIKESGRYGAYLAGSGANGGGATGSKASGAGGKKFNEMTGAELSALRKENPDEYARLRDAQAN